MKERLIRQRELTARLNTYRDEYYNQNAPSVSDAVYDRLFDELTELEKETGVVMSNSPTQTVGYPVVSRLPQAKHDIPLLSLDKTKLISELLAFQNGRAVNFSLKLDGLTTEIIYEGGLLQRLSTRGDGDIGEDITHNAEAIEGIPVQIPYKERLVVAGESFIHCSDFERLRQKLVDSTGKPYRNSRNLAAGSVRAYNSAVCAKRCVHFLPFAVIEGLPEIEAETDSKRMKLAKLTEFGFGRVRSLQFTTANNDMMDLHIIAMDIPMIGNTASAALGRCFDQSLRAFEVAVDSGYDFTQLPDFGETLHNNIHEWFSVEENRILWEELKPMVNIEKKETAMSVVQDNPFVGKTLVVTGKVEPYTRDGINAKIYSLGAKAGSSVSKNTDYLICGENAGSKLAKAQALGVAVLSPAEFFRMIGE